MSTSTTFYVDRDAGVFEAPQASTLANPAGWLVDALTYGKSESGAVVNWSTTMGLSAAWYCVNRISNDVAQMPLCLYTRNGDGTTEEDKQHPAGRLMRLAFGSSVNAFHLRKTLQAHALVSGNGRAFIARNGRGEPLELIPLPHHKSVTVLIYPDNQPMMHKQKWHVVYDDNGKPIPVPDYDVLHIFGQSEDGYSGIAPIDILKNPLGTSLATEKTAAKFFKNNAVPGIVLEAPPGVFRQEQEAQLFLQRWNDYHAGLDNTSRAGLLREGIKANRLSVEFDKAQMIQAREFSVREIMRVFGVPMIPGVSDSQSYNSLEQLNRAYLLHCLGPWLAIWCTECQNKLLTSSEVKRESHYFEFDTWELVKPSATERAAMLTQLVSGMIITTNEARNWEGLPPIDGGDVLRNPNTSTGSAAPAEAEDSPEDDAEDDQEQEDAMKDTSRKLILARLTPLVNAEVRRVKEMASKARNFMNWCDAYYEKHEQRFSEAVQSVGGESWMATEFIEQSMYLLCEAAGVATKDTFSATIDDVTASWPQRLSELADTICGA